MPRSVDKEANKHQAKSRETQAKILNAAEATFSEQGFENTQLEEVAARAGYTRGAIYAHYANKEDLFLAVMEHRVIKKFTAIREIVEAEPVIAKRSLIFKRWLSAQLVDRAWGTLMLEFKLYAMRRPRSREKLQHMFDPLLKATGEDFIEVLFGNDLSKVTRAAVQRRLTILGAIISAVILESHFWPKLLPESQLKGLLEDLYDALIHA